MIAAETSGETPGGFIQSHWLIDYSDPSSERECQSNTIVMIHDAFQRASYWNGVLQPPTYHGVILDTHKNQIFSVAVWLPDETSEKLNLATRKIN